MGNSLGLGGTSEIGNDVVGGDKHTRAGIINNVVVPEKSAEMLRRPGELESLDNKIDFLMDVLIGNGYTRKGFSGDIEQVKAEVKTLQSDVDSIRRNQKWTWFALALLLVMQAIMVIMLLGYKATIESIEAASTPAAIIAPGPQ